MANIFFKAAGWLFFERPAKNKTYAELKAAIEQGTEQVRGRIVNASDQAGSHGDLTHLIGIERWIQRRVQVALGRPFVQEEYDGYRPPREASWDDLQQAFLETRRASCELLDQLMAADVDGQQRVYHNDFGDMTINGWLNYLNLHANLTSRLVK